MPPKIDVTLVIPQFFYDLIARMVPGATLLLCAAIITFGPVEGLRMFTAWSFLPAEDGRVTGWVIFPCNVLLAYVLGTLLGGIWFALSRRGAAAAQSGWKRLLNGFAGNGERLFEQHFTRTFHNASVWVGHQQLNALDTTRKIAFMYDFLHILQPNVGMRIAKLRAEQHMAGVFMIGFSVLSIAFPFVGPWPSASIERRLIQAGLLAAVAAAACLAWHLERRSGTGLYYSWLTAFQALSAEHPDAGKVIAHRATAAEEARARQIAAQLWRACGSPPLTAEEECELYYRGLSAVRFGDASRESGVWK
ncbi:MAG: hypothetical protein RIC55_20105 [Pirellulaceae bacterium]